MKLSTTLEEYKSLHVSGALVIRWQAEERENRTNVTLKGFANYSAIRKHKTHLSTDSWLLEEWSLGTVSRGLAVSLICNGVEVRLK